MNTLGRLTLCRSVYALVLSGRKSRRLVGSSAVYLFYSRFLWTHATDPKMRADKQVLRRVDDIIKSPEDKRSYRGLELANHMKVLLVSDPTTDKAAAALDVNIGHLSDPADVPGLAHFLEHMLFMGTKKYPSENDYSKFLSEHGGSANASTHSDHTNYYFDVVPEHLPGALDRFAQFFLEPLFTESSTERELNAVNSEHEKNKFSDLWRLDQLEKHLSNPTHPYHKFGTGNKKTLEEIPRVNGINLREKLLEFHKMWYSANLMALIVWGKESLDELEILVVDLFSAVENKNIEVPRWEQHPFGQDGKQASYAYVVPVKDMRNLSVVFPCPDLHKYYKSQPGNYISHLVGHEGPGSLLSALKNRGWCNSLMGGYRIGARGFGFFGISVDLTEEGLKHVDGIVKLIFQYLNMLKDEGPKLWIHEEFNEITAILFRFQDVDSPRTFVTSNAHHLHMFPLEEVLSGNFLVSDWTPDVINELLGSFVPENLRVAVVAKAFEPNAIKTEPWYGTSYYIEDIPKEKLDIWRNSGRIEELKLPEKNEFIPSNFDMVPKDNDITQFPIIIQDSAISRIWFKQDDEFKRPKAVLTFDFVSPLAYADPLNCNLTHMFVQLFQDSVTEFVYAAELAGLKLELTNTKYGLILKIGGYNDKQHVFLDKVMEKLTNFKVDAKRFEIIKENYIRALKNFAAEQPYQHAVYYLAVLLTEHSWTKQELLASMDQLTVEKLEAFIPQILSKMHIESLIHGNVNKEKALQLMNIVKKRLTTNVTLSPLLPRQLLLNRELLLEDGCNYVYEVENSVHKSSCTEIYYQCGIQSTRSNMLLELLTQIIQEPSFNTLRTKEQLGYIVFSGIRRSNGVQGLRIIVQSERHPNYVEARVENFLKEMLTVVKNMSEEDFQKHKDSLAAIKLERPKRLSVLSARFWAEIVTQQYHFDRVNVEVAYLKTLTKDDVIEFYESLIAAEAERRHKLAVHVVSTAAGGAGHVDTKPDDGVTSSGTKIEDVTCFKSSHGMFPLVQPYMDIPRKGCRSKL